MEMTTSRNKTGMIIVSKAIYVLAYAIGLVAHSLWLFLLFNKEQATTVHGGHVFPFIVHFPARMWTNAKSTKQLIDLNLKHKWTSGFGQPPNRHFPYE